MAIHLKNGQTAIRQTLDAFLEPRIQELREDLATLLGWLADAHIENREDALGHILDTVVEILGNPLEIDQQSLIERLERVSTIGPIRGGSGKAWSVPTQDVRNALSTIRGMHKEVSPFLWNEADAECAEGA